MGTSQSINPSAKSNPNWGLLSRAISSASGSDAISDNQLNGIMKHFVRAVGGSGAGHGRSNVFGKAGIKRAHSFMAFVSDTKQLGFNQALQQLGITDTSNLSINDFINHLLVHCTKGNSNFDETAANAAMDNLLRHILNEAEVIEDVKDIFQQTNIEVQHEWLCYFFASYIMEFSDELFSTRIFEKEQDRVKIFQEINKYILRSLQEIHIKDNMQNINWHSEQGSAIIKNLQTEILEIWSQE